MERLAFGFYRAFFDELESYETHFAQLRRDFARDKRGEKLVFAVDFSELHDYMHANAERTTINRYVLNTLNDQFSILPGAVGELLSDLEYSFPKHFRTDFTKALLAYPAVVQFRSGFPKVENEERLVNLYAEAEAELKRALGDILHVLVQEHHYTPVQALQGLLREGKLTPIDGLQQLGTLSSDAKILARERLVENYLELDRPDRPENNQTDAEDFTIALLLNQHRDPSKRYITIYSQAESLIRACKTHDDLRWDNEYMIREAKYLQFRTKLQEIFPEGVGQRQKYIENGLQLCKNLKAEISSIIDIDEHLHDAETSPKKSVEPSLRLIDGYRRFDEEYRQVLSFGRKAEKLSHTEERARQLYETLKDESRFVGKVEESYDVFKEHLKKIESSLQVFTPVSTDTENARKYKTDLRRWLGLDLAEKKNPTLSEEDKDNE